jgi:Cu+-exporting ATPase
VRGALEGVAGVRSAVVDWEAGTAVVIGNAAVPDLVDAVEDTGKDAAELTTCTLAVDGMMCGNCETKVRGALEGVAGVRSAVVDWEAGTAVVIGSVPGAVLADAVEDTGKDAAVTHQAAVKPQAAGRTTTGESKRLGVESPWSQFTSECQRF